MILVTDEQRAALRANADNPGADPCPVVKLFNPVGPATCLATELGADGDTLLGLCRASHKPKSVSPLDPSSVASHVAVRAAMLALPGVALRLMVAHAIAGSPLWTVRLEPQTARSDAIRESVETAPAEALFDQRRRDVLALLGLDPKTATVRQTSDDADTLLGMFLRLLTLDDGDVLRVLAIVMGETLAAASPAVDAVGLTLGVDMADWWETDEAFFDLIRDREVLVAMLRDVGGKSIAEANTGEKTKTIKAVIADRLDGANGRAKVDRWVPRWMSFPPAGYTARGGVGTIAANVRVAEARAAAECAMPAPLPLAA